MYRFVPVLCLAAFLSFQSASEAEVIMNITESGNDVVVTATGSFHSLAGLSDLGSGSRGDSWMEPVNAYVETGSGDFDLYQGLNSYPSSIGTGIFYTSTSTTGSQIGVTSYNTLLLDPNYVLDAAIDSTATFANQSFASLGLTPGDQLHLLMDRRRRGRQRRGALPFPSRRRWRCAAWPD